MLVLCARDVELQSPFSVMIAFSIETRERITDWGPKAAPALRIEIERRGHLIMSQTSHFSVSFCTQLPY